MQKFKQDHVIVSWAFLTPERKVFISKSLLQNMKTHFMLSSSKSGITLIRYTKEHKWNKEPSLCAFCKRGEIPWSYKGMYPCQRFINFRKTFNSMCKERFIYSPSPTFESQGYHALARFALRSFLNQIRFKWLNLHLALLYFWLQNR